MTLQQTQKAQLRSVMRHVLSAIKNDDADRQSLLVQNHLFKAHERFLKSKHIGIYIAQRYKEIDTCPIIEKILEQYKDKHVYVPHIESSSDEMQFYHLKDTHAYENDMTTMNKLKIRQFKTIENLVEIDPAILDLIIVPGMAFSQGKDKYRRIGRGKGYYDRYLSRIPDCYTIGLCFNQQFIPNDYTDLSVPSVYGQDFEINELLCENTMS